MLKFLHTITDPFLNNSSYGTINAQLLLLVSNTFLNNSSDDWNLVKV